MFETMKINNRCDVFGIEKTSDNKYIIYKYDSNAMMRTNAILWDGIFPGIEIEPFKTLEKCYDFMVSYLNDLM